MYGKLNLKRLFHQSKTLWGWLFLLLFLTHPLRANSIVLELKESQTIEVEPYTVVDLEFPKSVYRVVTSADFEDNFGVEVISRHVFVRFKGSPKGMIYVLFDDKTSVAVRFKETEKGITKVRFILPPATTKSAEIPTVYGRPLKKSEMSDFVKLIRAMYNGDISPEFKVNVLEKPKPYPLPSELVDLITAKVVRIYYKAPFWGYVLVITAKKDVNLKENDFYALGIRGVAIPYVNLKKNEQTYAFIVSERPILQEE